MQKLMMHIKKVRKQEASNELGSEVDDVKWTEHHAAPILMREPKNKAMAG